MNMPTLIGLTGISLLLSMLLLKSLLYFRFNKKTAYLIVIVFFVLTFIPLSGYSINLYFRGLFNDLSISSLILIGYYFITPDNSKSQSQPVFSLLAISGLFFYPAALGFGPVDPYAWGFFTKAHGLLVPLTFLLILAGLMYFAFCKKYTLMLICLVVSTMAYQLGLLESRNFWDYLLDPLIFFYAFVSSLTLFIKKHLIARPGRGTS